MRLRSVLRGRTVALVVGLSLFWSYSRILIGAGDGAAFVYQLVIYGEAPEWRLPQIAAWLAVASELVSYATFHKKVWVIFAAFSTGSLLGSLLLFIFRSETLRLAGLETDRLMLFGVIFVIRILQIISRIITNLPNHVPDPTPTAVTAAAGQPPRQP